MDPNRYNYNYDQANQKEHLLGLNNKNRIKLFEGQSQSKEEYSGDNQFLHISRMKIREKFNKTRKLRIIN